jgi:tripartite-type tricarboxylate transporter receptor subunit TctC
MQSKPAVILAVAWGLASLSSALAAQPVGAYPGKPVRIIVPWAPGGSTDLLARAAGQKLAETWKQPVIVDNRPGASGNVGSDIVAKAQPDGYTLLVGSMSTHVMNPALYEKMPFKGVEDFEPVALMAYVRNVLVVHPSVPAHSVKELIALARSQPAKISYASAGVGSTNHLCAELFRKLAGVDIFHVPYKGGGPAVVDLVGGQVMTFFTGYTNVAEHVKAGRLKLLAVTEAKRAPYLPNVPTIGETLPGYEMAVYYAMFAPKRTPRPIVDQLNAETNRVLALPEVRSRLTAIGAEPEAISADRLGAILKADIDKWTKIIREIGARAE